MSKIFRVEEGNVLRLVMDFQQPPNYLTSYFGMIRYERYLNAYNNRESYPYDCEDWEVGEIKELDKDFTLWGYVNPIVVEISKPTNK